jgi:glyoxylase-like metal-dependent hydrolase (beta-lactamase superfamily II)
MSRSRVDGDGWMERLLSAGSDVRDVWTMNVGSLEIVPIIDGTSHDPVEAAVSHPEGRIWDCPHDPVDERGRLRFDIGSFLIRIKDRTILIDTGGGVFSDEETATGELLDNLRRQAVEPHDVTDVFFTHMHWDHVGWSTTNGEVTFPNATIHVHEDDWAYFMTGPTAVPQVRDVVAPVESRVEAFDREFEPIPGLIARPAPGHTPGTTIYVIHSEGERALLLGDTLHTVGELIEPEWFGMWDVDPVAARIMRNRISEELIETGNVFAAAHFPELAFGRLFTASGMRKFTWVP